MSSITTISLVRHGHIHNPTQVFHGRLPGFELSETGRAEASAAGRALDAMKAPVTAIYASPMLRAKQTAGLIQDALTTAPAIAVADELNEIYSPFDGSPRTEMDARDWDFYTGVSGDYEQPEDILRRVLHFVQRMRRLHAGKHVVGVSHADPLAFLWQWLLEMELDVEGRKRLDDFGAPFGYPATASITTLRYRKVDPQEQPAYSYWQPDLNLPAL